MDPDLISKKTRDAFEDALAAGSTLHRIGAAFDGAGIVRETAYKPISKGERRTLVSQYYRTLDFTKPGDVRRLLRAYEAILEDFEYRLSGDVDRLESEARIDLLNRRLANEGLKYANAKIRATTSDAHPIFATPRQQKSITEVSRRAIFDHLIANRVAWHGRFSEADFLERVFDLEDLDSTDVRFNTMREDVVQHTTWNDWSDDWVFSDPRLDLVGCDDSVLLRFLCEMVHPAVRQNAAECESLVRALNEHLGVDGWELAAGTPISGRACFEARRLANGTVALPTAGPTDVLSDEYVRELSAKCESRLASGDLDGAITVARTFLESVLGELELRLTGERGDHKGELPKQFKVVAKRLGMHERQDLDDRFKDVVRGLIASVNGLAPLRNKLSDGHARVRKPALHHARFVVNAARTVASFLVESFAYQQERGLLSSPSNSQATP